jgi:hypothetical protein
MVKSKIMSAFTYGSEATFEKRENQECYIISFEGMKRKISFEEIYYGSISFAAELAIEGMEKTSFKLCPNKEELIQEITKDWIEE